MVPRNGSTFGARTYSWRFLVHPYESHDILPREQPTKPNAPARTNLPAAVYWVN